MLRFSDICKYAESLAAQEKPSPGKTLTTKVSGVSFEGRQALIRAMSVETAVKVERDRSNEHDCYAVAVKALIAGIWMQVGFVPRPQNKTVAELLDQSADVSAELVGINKREDDRYNIGMTVRISFWQKNKK